MDFIQWTNRLEIGIIEIDHQHQTLIGLINVIANLESEKDQLLLNRKIEINMNHLIDYTNYHFQTEEDLFEKTNYIDFESHKLAHQNLKIKLLEIYSQHEQGADILTDLIAFLKSWLENHIIGSDLKYVSTIKKSFPDL